jgi:hypothetical protein
MCVFDPEKKETVYSNTVERVVTFKSEFRSQETELRKGFLMTGLTGQFRTHSQEYLLSGMKVYTATYDEIKKQVHFQ